MNPRNFFAELKRRNVYKVAIAYAIVAWLLIQAASILFPTFEAPPWVMKAAVAMIALGFPIALIIAWAFEMTPEGMKRTEDVAPGEVIPQWSRRKFAALIVSVAIVAAGLLAFQFLRSKSITPGNPVTTSAPTPTAASAAIPEQSIAVLPFDNLSHDPENAYFADGIQDEILTRLAKIAELKVISRTSTQRFKSAPGDLRQIAQQLGVTNIMEGSVQKSADQVRVNVQLINATTDAHLWADTYDRKLTDIFAVESEIAKSVAEKLRAKLTGAAEHVLASRPTENPEAHQLYLKGRYFWNKRSGENLKKAIDYFQQAIEKDPNYALAYSGLADAYSLLPVYAGTRPRDDVPKAMAAAKKALELDDTLAEAHASLGQTLLEDMQLDRSTTEFKRAIELNPNYATAHHWYGSGPPFSLGRWEEAITEARRAQELDPLSVIIASDLGGVLSAAGRYDEAIAQFRKTIEMEPGFYSVHQNLGFALEGKGDLDKAIAEFSKAAELDPDPNVLGSLGHALARAGRTDEARKILGRLIDLSKQRYISAYSLAIVYLALGDKEQALRFLEKSYEDRAGFDIGGIKFDRNLEPLHGDPRFEKLAQRILSGKSE